MPTVTPQLFSKHKDEWLNFYIVLKDPKQAARLTADHPNGVALSPIDAGILCEVLLHRLRDGDAGAAEPVESSQIIWTPWWEDTKGHVFPTDEKSLTFTAAGSGASAAPRPTTAGSARFKRPRTQNRPVTPGTGPEGPIGRRRWIGGFELASMTAAPAGGSLGVSRDASRHVGGLGLAFRGATSDVFAKALNLYGTPVGFAHASWERFYLRLRRAPTSATPIIWKCNGFPSSHDGAALGINPAGQLVLYSAISPSSYNLIAAVFDLDVWHPSPIRTPGTRST